MVLYNNTYCHVSLITRRIWKIDNIPVNILFYLISNQINDIKLMWDEIKEEVFTQRNKGALYSTERRKTDGCYSTKRRKTDGDDSTKRGIKVRINRDTPTTPTNEEAFNGQRHTDNYVSVWMGVLSYLIHIQFFSQNQSLLSSISNQIIIKRVSREKQKRQRRWQW